MMAVRMYKRSQLVGDFSDAEAQAALAGAGITSEVAEAIFRPTTQPGYYENYVIPPMGREIAIAAATDDQSDKDDSGFGYRRPPRRGV